MTATEPNQPPTTGVPRIDEALAELDLGEDVTTHPAALASALEALQQALNQP